MSYTTAALDGYGYTNAALEGYGYTDAALEGCGYNEAALEGCGRRKVTLSGHVRKGSPEAKARMAYLRSLRKTRGGRLPFDYPKHIRPRKPLDLDKPIDRKENMGDIVRQQMQPRWHITDYKAPQNWKRKKGGGFNPFATIGKSLQFWGKYGKSWYDDSKRDKETLARLEKLKKQRGGKFELRDLRDGLLGPIGWIRMGIRKSRQKKIDALKKELGVN